MNKQITDFLNQKRIAVVGVRRDKTNEPGNLIYRKLRDLGYEVFAVNPNCDSIENDRCYHTIDDIPGVLDGVVITTNSKNSIKIVEQALKKGISRIWMHRSFGEGSVSKEAIELCEAQVIEPIIGGCPMMFCEPVDFPHKCMRWILKISGKL